MLSEQESVIEQPWHNLYRMHGYLEAALGVIGEERPGLLRNADRLLAASHGRVVHVLNDTRRPEPLPGYCK